MPPRFDLEKLAKLARIDLDDAEKKELTEELERILEFMSSLDKVNTEGVAPLFHPNNEHTPLRNDAVREGLDGETVRELAPDCEGPWIRVPKVME